VEPGPPLEPLDKPPPKKTLKPPSPRELNPPQLEVQEQPCPQDPVPPPPPPPGRPGPPLGIDTDFEDTMRSGVSSEGGVKHSLESLWKSQQSPMSRGAEDDLPLPPPPPVDGEPVTDDAPPPPPPPGARPGPALGLDPDLFEGSLHSMASEASTSPSGGRKRITLGGLASSSQNMAGNMRGKVNSPAVNRAKPKRASVVTRQPQNFERPDNVAPPPRPPPMPPASPMHHVGTPQSGHRPPPF